MYTMPLYLDNVGDKGRKCGIVFFFTCSNNDNALSTIIICLHVYNYMLNPDRSVVQAIRKCAALQRLVYVSCNPDGARKNIVE